jgi:hypothetical protein
MHRRCPSQVVEGCWDDGAGVRAEGDHAGVLARDLPETALRAASRRPTIRPSAASLACSVAWVGEVVRGDVNHPHINGMQGVRGSNPLSSTRHNASAALPLRAVCQQIVSRSRHVAAITLYAVPDSGEVRPSHEAGFS